MNTKKRVEPNINRLIVEKEDKMKDMLRQNMELISILINF